MLSSRGFIVNLFIGTIYNIFVLNVDKGSILMFSPTGTRYVNEKVNQLHLMFIYLYILMKVFYNNYYNS